jgi:hypothetical protein
MQDDPINNSGTAAATGLAPENAPAMSGLDAFDDLATPSEGAGPWPKGWYRATIVEGYTTGKGTAFETRDALAKSPGSRNLFLCVQVSGDVYVPSDNDPDKRKLTKGPGGTRNIRATYNYKPSDMQDPASTAARIKAAREHYKNVQGAWPDKDLQSSSLSIGRLSQLKKAVGFTLPYADGRFDVRPFVKQQIDVRLGIDDKGFSEITAVEQFGAKVK